MNNKTIRIVDRNIQLIDDKEAKTKMFYVLRIMGRDFFEADDIENWEEDDECGLENGGIFNYLISICTYGADLQRTNEVLTKGIDTLSDIGKMACVVPASWLDHPDSQKTRKMLVEKRVLDKVLLLHPSWSYDTEKQCAIIFLKKEEHKQVKFVDPLGWDFDTDGISINGLSNMLYYGVEHKYANTCMEGEQKYPLYEDASDEFEDEFNRLTDYASFDEIKGNHYMFLPCKYIRMRLPERKGYIVDTLYSFLWNDDYFREEIEPNSPFYKFTNDLFLKNGGKHGSITGRIFSDEFLNKQVDGNEIAVSTYEGSYYEINGNAIVVSTKGELRPSLVYAERETVIIPMKNNFAFLLDSKLPCYNHNEQRIDISYVYKELMERQNQLTEISIYAPDDAYENINLLKIYIPDSPSQITRQKLIDLLSEQKNVLGHLRLTCLNQESTTNLNAINNDIDRLVVLSKQIEDFINIEL